MDTLTYPIFTDIVSEYNAVQQSCPPPFDFTDSSATPPSVLPSLTSNPCLIVTNPITAGTYYELEFNLANNFWGCQFNLGNAACGTHIRQAFAHGLDKNQFLTIELSGTGQAIDNPAPSGVTLGSPNPCAWDTSHPQTGSNCVTNAPGGTAYHLQSSTVAGVACPGAPSTPGFTYTPQCGTPDFCAAADHLIAAGIATGKNSATCVLTGVSSSVSTNPIQFYVRNDDIIRLHAGNSYAQFICALLSGAYTTACTGISVIVGPGPPFCGFLTSTTGLNLCWWVYTAGFDHIDTFDNSLYNLYDSRFVDGIPSIKPPCSTLAVPTTNPSNYVWLCNPTYDSDIEQAEFAPCLTAPPSTAPDCPGTSQLSAQSAANQAQDIFGQNAYTIPLYTPTEQFAYATGWTRAVVHQLDGFRPPGNYFLTLDAYNPSPPVPETIRQAYSSSTKTSNPFAFSGSPQDAGVIGSVYDSLAMTDPSAPTTTYMDWMAVSNFQLAPSQLTYIPPPGTVDAFRYTLRNDIFWQTGQRLTAWDVAFSYSAYRVNGVMPGLSPVTGIKVLSPTQFDIDVNAVGPYTKLNLSNPVIPARDWVNNSICTASVWDAAANNPNFAVANSALTACIAPSSAVTPSGVITPNASNIDSTKVQPTYDPVAAGNLIGSGPWVCQSGSTVGSGCSSNGTSSPPAGGSWTFQRYGKGTAPGSSLNVYFRSNGNLALYAWTGNTGIFTTDFLNFSQSAFCFMRSPVPSGCNRWGMGIGNPTGSSSSLASVGLVQISIVQRFVGVNWVSPYNWVNSPPPNIAVYPPILYEGGVTMNPANLAGCTSSFNNGGGYDC